MKTKTLYKHLHEGPMDNIRKSIFELEDVLPMDHHLRKMLFKIRCDLGNVIMINREEKDKPQDRWVSDD